MARPETPLPVPRDLKEMIVYEALLRSWGRVVLDSEQGDPFALAGDLARGHGIPAGRMLDLNFAAYQDLVDISELQVYPAKHAVNI